MRWPFRYKPHPSDVEGKAKARMAEAIADQIKHHAELSEREHRDIQRRNNLGPKFHTALGGR